ncbi:UNVERIFIED_CONTAM: hypothetical protein Sradi_2517200 [Sesamum radiatum]|uniref:Uncharacterized protein n=1 Tax=Sesamum radiatum TaxID=300843 RepID=A0AAW2SLE8_SESRA
MEALSNIENKQKAVDTSSKTQTLQVVTGIPPLLLLEDLLLPLWNRHHLPLGL